MPPSPLKAVLIVAPHGYQELEYQMPKQILEKAGILTTTASRKSGKCLGQAGGSTTANLSLDQVHVDEYDIILFVGGPGAVLYQHDAEAHRIAQEAIQKKKLLTAICIAPTILAYAGVLQGKKATVWNADGEQQAVLEKNGATYTGEDLTLDGSILTANGLAMAGKFGKKIVEVTIGLAEK